MPTRMKWNGEEFFRSYKRALAIKLEKAVAHMHAWAADRMKREGKFPGVRVKRLVSKRNSLPGEYPMKQTGHLLLNLAHEVDERSLVARFGTNVIYGKLLEIGTAKIKPRPWLSRTMKETKAFVRDILKKPILTRGGK